jgi:excisionase family DNA binding protein
MTVTIDNEYITLAEAAKVLGLSRSMIVKLIQSRDLIAHRFGPRAHLVRLIDAERLKEKRATR